MLAAPAHLFLIALFPTQVSLMVLNIAICNVHHSFPLVYTVPIPVHTFHYLPAQYGQEQGYVIDYDVMHAQYMLAGSNFKKSQILALLS